MEIIYKRSKGIFVCNCSFHEKDKPKSAGFWWNPIQKIWWCKRPDIAEKLILHCNEDAKKAIKELKEESLRDVEKSRAINAEISVPAPEGMDYYPFQKAGIEYMSKRNNVLLSDQLGTGKTIQVLGLMNLQKPKWVLVVCPNSLKLNWVQEAQKWLLKYNIVMCNTIKERNYSNSDDGINVAIINYDILEKPGYGWIKETKWDMLVVDEAHMIKNYRTKRAKAVEKIRSERRIYLTGTPIVNKPIDMYNILSHLGFKYSFWEYAKRYCGAYKSKFGWQMDGATNLEELQEKLRGQLMLRRLKKDVLKELPDIQRQLITVTSTNTDKAVEEEKKAIENYKEELKECREIEPDFGEISIARKQLAEAKVPLVVDHVKNLLEHGIKVVVFAHHRSVMDKIKEAFGDKAVGISGGDCIDDRNRAVNEFQNNPDVKVFVGSIMAAGTGLTLTASSTVVFAELDWVPGNISQCEGRCHRIGQEDCVTVHHLVVDGSLDVKLANTIVQKQEIIEKAMDENIDVSVKLKDLIGDE